MNTQLLINLKHTLDAEMTKKITQKFNIWKNDFLHLLYPRYCIICNMDTPQIQATICPVCSNELHYSNYENYLEATPLDKIFWEERMYTTRMPCCCLAKEVQRKKYYTR